MDHVIDEPLAFTMERDVGRKPMLSAIDATACLAAYAGAAWDVEHAVDPCGVVSIIVLSAYDDPTLPTFMLYEEYGLARVATIRRDVWESDQAFPSAHRAVAAIKAATAALAAAI